MVHGRVKFKRDFQEFLKLPHFLSSIQVYSNPAINLVFLKKRFLKFFFKYIWLQFVKVDLRFGLFNISFFRELSSKGSLGFCLLVLWGEQIFLNQRQYYKDSKLNFRYILSLAVSQVKARRIIVWLTQVFCWTNYYKLYHRQYHCNSNGDLQRPSI